MRIVIVVDGDFTVRQSGSHSRFSDLIRWMSAHVPGLVVYSWSDHPTLPWSEAGHTRFSQMFPGVELVLEKMPRVGRLLCRIKGAALTFAPRYARLWLSIHAPGMPKMRAFLNDPSVRLVVSRTELLVQLNGVPINPAVIDTHDIGFINKARSSGASIYDGKVLAKLRREFACLETCALVIAISASEQVVLSSFLPSLSCLLIPDFRPAPLIDQTRPAPQYDLLFVGSDYHFNVTGLSQFIRNNRDWLGKFRLAVAGKVCDVPEIAQLVGNDSSVSLLGYVDDLMPLYASTKVAISPVSGTGLKIKVLDALHAHTPVLASTESLEGLPQGYDGVASLLTRENAEAILGDDRALRAARERAAAYVRSLAAEPAKAALLAILSTEDEAREKGVVVSGKE